MIRAIALHFAACGWDGSARAAHMSASALSIALLCVPHSGNVKMKSMLSAISASIFARVRASITPLSRIATVRPDVGGQEEEIGQRGETVFVFNAGLCIPRRHGVPEIAVGGEK